MLSPMLRILSLRKIAELLVESRSETTSRPVFTNLRLPNVRPYSQGLPLQFRGCLAIWATLDRSDPRGDAERWAVGQTLVKPLHAPGLYRELCQV